MRKRITSLLRYGTLLSTLGFILSVLLQIFARFLLPNAPPWTEEASRFCFIYAVAFSAGLAFESQAYVYLDWFFNKLSARWQSYLRTVASAISFVLFLTIAYHSIAFVKLGQPETSPGMDISMSYVFFSMFILSGSLSYYIGLDLLDTLGYGKTRTRSLPRKRKS